MIRNWIKKIVNAQIDDRLMDGIDYDQLSEKLSEVPDLVQELSKYFDIDEALSHVADNIDLYDLANHIDVHDVAVYAAGTEEDIAGKAKFAIPLQPGLAYL